MSTVLIEIKEPEVVKCKTQRNYSLTMENILTKGMNSLFQNYVHMFNSVEKE